MKYQWRCIDCTRRGEKQNTFDLAEAYSRLHKRETMTLVKNLGHDVQIFQILEDGTERPVICSSMKVQTYP